MRLGWLVVSFPIYRHPRGQPGVHDQIDRDRLVMVWCLHRVERLGVLVAGVGRRILPVRAEAANTAEIPVDRVAETFVSPSVIEGVGVFAAEPIAAGRIIYATRPHTSPQPQLCDIQCTTMHEQLLPLVVFLAEMTVVTISTMRIIFVGRGLKKMAAGLGFFEVSIWLFAIGQLMSNLNRPQWPRHGTRPQRAV